MIKTASEESNAMTSIPIIVSIRVDAIFRFVILERIKRLRPAVMTDAKTINMVTSDHRNSYEMAAI